MIYLSLRNYVLTRPLVQRSYHYLISKIIGCYIISFPKSGRTWLRMLLAQAISMKTGKRLTLDVYKMTFGSKIINVATDPRPGNYSSFNPDKLKIPKQFKNKKIIFLVRDPRDVVVSYFFEWTKRRKLIYEKGLSDFIKEDFTLKQIVSYMNLWAEQMNKRENQFLMIKYENIHKNPRRELNRMLNFLKIEISENTKHEAVINSSFDNMFGMEKGEIFKGDHRLQPTNKEDRESYKMRKGKIGDHLNHFSKSDLDYVNNVIRNNLNLCFNYN